MFFGQLVLLFEVGRIVMKVLFVSKDIGNVVNGGAPVAQVFQKRGHAVTYVLDAGGKAGESYLKGTGSVATNVYQALNGLSVSGIPASGLYLSHSDIDKADAVLVTLSGSGVPNVECDAIKIALQLGKLVYGIEDMFGGRYNPGFEDLRHNVLRLFTIIPMPDDDAFPVRVVGPLAVERYRGVSVGDLGARARQKLGLSPDTAVVYWTGHPRPESPHALSRLCEAVVALRIPVTLVVARHSRDRAIPYNSAAHRSCLLLAAGCGVQVLENSLDHRDLSASDTDAILEQFRPPDFATYQELLCACADRGVIVSGFGTDAAVVAPYLKIPSVLFIDENSFLLGRALREEKRIEHLPLAYLRERSTVEGLCELFADLLTSPTLRQQHCLALHAVCPFPECNPAELIADIVMRDAGC